MSTSIVKDGRVVIANAGIRLQEDRHRGRAYKGTSDPGWPIGFGKMPGSSLQKVAMTSHYPIVLERETNGSVSAYVVRVPGVFAAADSEAAAARAIRSALQAHLAASFEIPPIFVAG